MNVAIEDIFDVVVLTEVYDPAQLAIALPNGQYRANSALPGAALPEAGRVASGRGTTLKDCRHSCVGEAAEMLSACFWGDERIVTARAADLGPQALSIPALNGFTAAQIAARDTWNREYGRYDWRPDPANATGSIAWASVEDAFSGRQFLAPADFLYLGRREPGDAAAVAIADSNGCAAGKDADSARLGALLELIERDATARWWHGRRRRPPIVADQVRAATALGALLADRARQCWLFDIATDLDAPVIAALSAEPDGSDVALGFAAKASLAAAMESAITEMLQMEFSLAVARASGELDPLWVRWRRTVTTALPPLDAIAMQPASTQTRESLTFGDLLEASARLGIDLYLADMTRAAVGIPVYRALSTTLCHYKPRLGRRRLFAPDRRDTACEVGTGAGTEQVPLLV